MSSNLVTIGKIVKQIREPELLISPSKSNVSKLSQCIIGSFKTKDVIAIFSQGPLNLTPLISAMHAERNQDVMVSLPSESFKPTYKKYTDEFFSMLYTKSTSPFAHQLFFYKKILWGTAKIRGDDEPLADLDIEKTPIHGNYKFKREYEEMMDKLLRSGQPNLPKIIFVQTKGYLPPGMIGKKNIRFKEKEYGCLEFDPSLIILESINERRFSFEGLLVLSKSAVEQGRKIILHFSWPYFEGLDQFILDLERDHGASFGCIHLGKRMCLELARDGLSSPPPYAMPISLEDGHWELYYSSGESIDRIKMIVPVGGQTEDIRNVTDLESSIDALDEAHDDILDNLGTLEQQNGYALGLLANPPIMDSVATPSESRIKTKIEQMGTWRYMPLQYYVRETFGPGSPMSDFFGRMAADLDRCRDLTAELNGAITHSLPRKKTAFQFIILDELAKAINATCWSKDGIGVSIILSDYHSMVATRRKVIENIVAELTVLSDISKAPLPEISARRDMIELSLGGSSVILYERGKLAIPDREQLEALEACLDFPNAKLLATLKDDEIKVEVVIEINCPILEAQPISNSQVKLLPKLFLPLFSARIDATGDYKTAQIKTLKIDDGYPSNEVTAQLRVKHSAKHGKRSRTQNIPIKVIYQRPEWIRSLPREIIINSTLIMPGPLPYFAIDDESVSMARGCDCVLLPFNKIVFLAYPGRNSQTVMRQLERFAAIYSVEHNAVSAHDLSHSLKLTHWPNNFRLPPQPRSAPSLGPVVKEAPLDELIREEQNLLYNSLDSKGIVSLKELWVKIGANNRRSGPRDRTSGVSGVISTCDQVIWQVDFGDSIENLSFTRGTFIRVKDDSGYSLKAVENLVPDDQILYLDTIERESVDNYLLRDYFGDRGITLEQVLEPIRCLSLFYDSIKVIRVGEPYDINSLKDIYWLNEKKKEALYKLIQIIQDDECPLEDLQEIWEDSIWADQLTLKDLGDIVDEGESAISYRQLYLIAKCMGFNLKESTFIQLFTISRNDGTHLFFRDESNLLAIARLIGYDDIAENYGEFNDMGREVNVALIMIGQSISRVASGRGELTEMDLLIEGKLKKGTIV